MSANQCKMMGMIKARLHPVGRCGLYNVLHNGELIVERSRDPEFDACRALLAKGITGRLLMCDGKTGMPRMYLDIEKAAKLTVREDRSTSPRLVKWRPMPSDLKGRQTCDGSAPSPKEDAA